MGTDLFNDLGNAVDQIGDPNGDEPEFLDDTFDNGQEFQTGATSFQISDIKLNLFDTAPTTGTLTIALFSDANNAPGSQISILAAINNNSLPTVSSSLLDVSFTGVTLAANTQYWIMVEDTTPAVVQWHYDQLNETNPGTGTAGEYWVSTEGGPSNTPQPWGMEVSGDTTAPAITSVTASPATGDLDAGNTVAITLTLGEAVGVSTTGGSPTLALNDGGTASYDAAASTGTTLVFDYTVAAGQNTANLAVQALALNGATITDGAGNALDVANAAAALGLQIDTTAPAITSVTASPAAGDLDAGHTVAITLATSEAVSVSTTGGSPTLALNDGGTASYDAAASTGTTLVFDYTVAAGQNTANLAVQALALNGATITDGAGNALDAANAAAALGLQIDTTAPTASSPSLTVAENAAATPIGIAAPSDPNFNPEQLTITIATLPTDGTVTATALSNITPNCTS